MINIVDGITDPKIIAEHFVSHFSKACSNNSEAAAARLKRKRANEGRLLRPISQRVISL